MKKFLLTIIMSCLLFSKQSLKVNAEEIKDNKLMYDTLITTLSPNINKAIVNYYDYSKSYDLFNIEIKKLQRIHGGFSFEITLIVKTFEHAHNPPYGIETITFEIRPSGVKALDFKHIGDEDEKQIKKFYNDTINDIKESFNLSLTDYKEYSYRQLHHLKDKQKPFESLYNITKDIVINILNKEIHPPYKNIINPVTYVKGNEGYILFKTADGTNVIYIIKKEYDTWIVIDEQMIKGKKMQNELIWYM